MVDAQTLQIVRDIIAILGVIIGFTYYVITLRNQTKSLQIQIIKGTGNPVSSYKFMELEWTDYDDYMDRHGDGGESQYWKDVINWFNRFEEYGVYVKEGMLNIRPIVLLSGGSFTRSWELYESLIHEHRKRINEPRWFIEAEYLYGKIQEYYKKHPKLAPQPMN